MASGLKRIGDLEIHQDLDFQRRSWNVQRIGWAIMALLILSALLGVFGHGPASHTVADDPSLLLSLEYERFGRYQSPLTLRVHVEPQASPDGRFLLWVSQEYLRSVQIQAIVPEPHSAHISPAGITYTFQLTQPDQGGDIIMHLEAHDIGVLSGKVGFTASQSIPFRQWIYP